MQSLWRDGRVDSDDNRSSQAIELPWNDRGRYGNLPDIHSREFKEKGKHVDYRKIRRNLELESYGQGHYC